MNKEKLEKEAEEYARNTYEMCSYSNLPYASDRRAREQAFIAGAEPREKRIAELEAQIEKMKCCENCGWYYLQQHWRESKEINESRMFHCGTCGNKKNWKLRR